MTQHTPVPEDGRAVVGATIAGRYELRAPIGDGGMGAVWRAHDGLLQRDVAVKEVLLPPELPAAERDTLVERTLREARAAAALSHASVIRVFDVITEGGRPWIIMELLQARSLADILKEDGPMPPRVVAKIGLSMLGALEAAHAAGILHRDVKPGNVLISSDGRCVLSDFGVARTNQPSNLTTPGMVLGSAHYIAPERATGGQIGPASDLFSLGVTLYAAVEGRPPFDRANALATMQAVVHDPPESPRRAGPLMAILGGLLDKDPHRRWTVEQTRAAIQQLLGGAGPLASQAVDGLTDLHRVIPQQPSRPVSSPPVSGAPVSAVPVSGMPTSAPPMFQQPRPEAAFESTAAHPAPSPNSGAYEQAHPFSPPAPPQGGYGEQTRPFTPPQPSHGGYGEETRPFMPPQPAYAPSQHQSSPYGPPQGQFPPQTPNYPPMPGQGGGGEKPGGVGGLLETAKKHTKPWMLAVAAGVVVVALIIGVTSMLGGGDEDNPGGATPTGNDGSNTAAEADLYTSPDGDYTVNVPKGWTIVPNGGNVIDCKDPANADRWIRFNVTKEKSAPDKLLTSAAAGLDGGEFKKDSLKQLKLEPITFGGHEGTVIEYTGIRDKDDVVRHALWAIIKVDGVNYHIYLSVPDDTFADSQAVFDQAVASYELVE
ncbi:protein kinase [Phytomonospora sp. NPDC050363]|uniref:serine/threonine-protein kinase n=1 Tax=Phytomonospora sp. NPDC050363 TaxID=3155642 RepID=UPI0033EA897D